MLGRCFTFFLFFLFFLSFLFSFRRTCERVILDLFSLHKSRLRVFYWLLIIIIIYISALPNTGK